MRLSYSLQDLSTYGKVNTEDPDPDPEAGRCHSRVKPFRALQRDGNWSSFSKEKSSPATVSIRKKWVRAAVAIFAIFVICLFIYICSRYFSSFSNDSSGYYIILDCGSTGTRVYVFEGSIDHSEDHVNLPIALKSLPVVGKELKKRSGRAYKRMETEPGFDKLVHNESGLKAAMKPLLKWAEKQIPRPAHKNTPLFLYATAGVRRLDSTDSEWLLDKAWSILKHSPFLCRREWVKIISGTEEAYYGWIALNYHLGILGSFPAKETFGALDLGGSSLQVTFATENNIRDESSINLSIGAVNHDLNAYSLSGYGLNDAFDKSVAHLFKKLSGTPMASLNSGSIELRHPCLQNGYREQYFCSRCASSDMAGSPDVGGHGLGKINPGVVVELMGTPQWEECNLLAKVAVNLSEWSNKSSGIDCKVTPCALDDDRLKPYGRFYAMSGFFVVFRFFNLTPEATLDEVLRRGQNFCEKTWEVAKNSVVPQPFVEQYCFRAPYIVSLLRDGLHITDKDVVVGSGSITWTLGVALIQAGHDLSRTIELSNYRMLNMNMSPRVLVLLLLILLLIVICVSFCVTKWKPGFLRRSVLPIFGLNSAATSKSNVPSPFSFQRWSPINIGDGRGKMPMSPTISSPYRHPSCENLGLGSSSLQLTESNLQPNYSVASHSHSPGSTGQMQYGNGTGSFLSPFRGQTTLQSRRSQSREDLISSLDPHIMKV